ncbi:MAG: alpha/beta hydrolase [Bacteroidetes bacterium]|nr:alpha/beta hydrolase [Bacteroidota bacterium]
MKTVLLILLFSVSTVFSQASKNLQAVAEAKQMIQLPEPVFESASFRQPDSATIADMGFEQIYACDTVSFQMRDKKHLFARRFTGQQDKVIVLLHGVLSSNFMMNRTAGLVREATGATIITLDLRGHGNSDGKPGDVDYIDQYADDLADVVSTLQTEYTVRHVFLAGHSMGGGIILRYAMQKKAPDVDGFLLLAPLLGHDAPTLPRSSGGSSEEPFMKIHLPRIIGLSILNSMGIHTYDSLPVLFFHLPPMMPIKEYSYRSNVSMAPAQYKDGLKAIKKPFLLLVGSKDEAFVAEEFEPAVQRYSKGKVVVVAGATHDGIRHHPETMKAIQRWIATVN